MQRFLSRPVFRLLFCQSNYSREEDAKKDLEGLCFLLMLLYKTHKAFLLMDLCVSISWWIPQKSYGSSVKVFLRWILFSLSIKYDWPCTHLWHAPTSVTRTVSSNQATLRHTKLLAYRCFLPDLTGFTGFHCVRPSFHCHLCGADPTGASLQWEFNPATADCRYKAPLPPRLARPNFLTILYGPFEPLTYYTWKASERQENQGINTMYFLVKKKHLLLFINDTE